MESLVGRMRRARTPSTRLTSAFRSVADFSRFTDALAAACKSVIAAEPEITRFDTIAGDGDCGLTLKSGAEGVLALVKSPEFEKYQTDAVGAILEVAKVVSHASRQ